MERVHAKENEIFSKHGPFKSNLKHEFAKTDSKEHLENMEEMAKEVISCLSEARYGGEKLVASRGITNDEFVFDDEEELKTFLSLSEGNSFFHLKFLYCIHYFRNEFKFLLPWNIR